MRSQQMKVGETPHSYDALGGDDIVYGSSYVDFIHGGAGNDQLFGNGGDDALLGWSGNDTLKGGVGNDLLHGGDGNDVLIGEGGSDALLGGFGDEAVSRTNSNTLLRCRHGLTLPPALRRRTRLHHADDPPGA